jgi:DNA-binding protein Fis
MAPVNLLTPENFAPVEEEAPVALDVWIARQLHTTGGSVHKTVMEKIEGELIRQALETCGGNKIKTARLLGINRNTLTKKVKDYALE